ncbi:unnamed protein product [Linum trigynum]|uniref:Uncharacterized protein n=1 Tax=Linum trigynum TaxID=586398 RepID=A0AAV2DDY6_9ROSI
MESQDDLNSLIHHKERKAPIRILELRFDTPFCELRSRNGASSELKSRNGASSTLFGGGTQAPENCVRRRPEPEPWTLVDIRAVLCPKRTLLGKFTSK